MPVVFSNAATSFWVVCGCWPLYRVMELPLVDADPDRAEQPVIAAVTRPATARVAAVIRGARPHRLAISQSSFRHRCRRPGPGSGSSLDPNEDSLGYPKSPAGGRSGPAGP